MRSLGKALKWIHAERGYVEHASTQGVQAQPNPALHAVNASVWRRGLVGQEPTESCVLVYRMAGKPLDQEVLDIIGLAESKVHAGHLVAQVIDQVEMQNQMFLKLRVVMLSHHVCFTVKVILGVEHDLVQDAVESFRARTRQSSGLKFSDQAQENMVLRVDPLDADIVLVIPGEHDNIQSFGSSHPTLFAVAHPCRMGSFERARTDSEAAKGLQSRRNCGESDDEQTRDNEEQSDASPRAGPD